MAGMLSCRIRLVFPFQESKKTSLRSCLRGFSACAVVSCVCTCSGQIIAFRLLIFTPSSPFLLAHSFWQFLPIPALFTCQKQLPDEARFRSIRLPQNFYQRFFTPVFTRNLSLGRCSLSVAQSTFQHSPSSIFSMPSPAPPHGIIVLYVGSRSETLLRRWAWVE